MGAKMTTVEYITAVASVAGVVVKVASVLGPLAAAINSGPLTAADMRPVVRAWQRLNAAALVYGIAVPDIELPDHTSKVGTFLRIIAPSSQAVEAAMAADIHSVTKYINLNPAVRAGDYFNKEGLTAGELEVFERFERLVEIFKLDAKVDPNVMPTVNSGRTLEIGASGTTDGRETAASKPMGHGYGLMRGAQPQTLDEGSTKKSFSDDSSWLGPEGSHVVTSSVTFVNSEDPLWCVPGCTNYMVDATTGPYPDTKHYVTGHTTLTDPARPADNAGRYDMRVGMLGPQKMSIGPPRSTVAPGQFGYQQLRIDDRMLLTLSTNHSIPIPWRDGCGKGYAMGGTFDMGNGNVLRRGPGQLCNDGLGFHVEAFEEINGVRTLIRPALGLPDSSVFKTEAAGMKITTEFSFPYYLADSSDEITFHVMITNVDTGEYFYRRVYQSGQGERGMVHLRTAVEVPIGKYNVSPFWTSDETFENVTINERVFVNRGDGQSLASGVLQRGSGVGADVTVQLTRKPRSGQVSVGSTLMAVTRLDGLDPTPLAILSSDDVLYTPHLAKGGANSASSSLRKTMPTTKAMIARNALNQTHIGENCTALGNYYSNKTKDDTWEMVGEAGAFEVFHPSSPATVAALPEATSHSTGGMTIVMRLFNKYAGLAYSAFKSMPDAKDWIVKMRQHFGFSINLQKLITTLLASTREALGSIKLPLITRQQFHAILDHTDIITATLAQVSGSSNVVARAIHAETTPRANVLAITNY